MASKNTAFYKAIAQIQARSRELYPNVGFHTEGFIQVTELHTLWWGQAGNPKGIPVVVNVGGPGANCSGGSLHRFFDPAKWNVIVYDPRGCGKSTPHACVQDNTQWETVKDINTILDHLKIEKAVIAGGSWGSTMSLTYAICCPERCLALILRGIFTLRRHELEFLYQKGASLIYPEFWEEFIKPIPVEERGDMMAAYAKRLFDDSNKEVQLACAKSWSVWEGSTCQAVPEATGADSKYSDDEFSLAFARIENHYFTNRGFWPEGNENWIYDNCHKLKDIPTFAVHGRYDMVCVIEAFHELKKAIPHGEFIVAPLSGHSANDPDVMSLLIDAGDRYAEKFKHLIGEPEKKAE